MHFIILFLRIEDYSNMIKFIWCWSSLQARFYVLIGQRALHYIMCIMFKLMSVLQLNGIQFRNQFDMLCVHKQNGQCVFCLVISKATFYSSGRQMSDKDKETGSKKDDVGMNVGIFRYRCGFVKCALWQVSAANQTHDVNVWCVWSKKIHLYKTFCANHG